MSQHPNHFMWYCGIAIYICFISAIHLSRSNPKRCMFNFYTEKYPGLCGYTGCDQHSKYLRGDVAVMGCWCHPSFLLANTTCLKQSLEQEVITSFKRSYCGEAYEAMRVVTDHGVDLAGEDWGGISVSDSQFKLWTHTKTAFCIGYGDQSSGRCNLSFGKWKQAKHTRLGYC